MSFRPNLVSFLLILLCLITGGCSERGIPIDITLTPQIEGADHINVTLLNPAQGAEPNTQTVPASLSRFIMRLPVDYSSPHARLYVAVVNRNGCLLADVSADVEAGAHAVVLQLTERNDGCTLHLQARGAGGGSFEAVRVEDTGQVRPVLVVPEGDSGRDFALRENAVGEQLKPRQSIRLTAIPDSRSYFVGWSGSCQGVEPCTLAVDSGALKARASFALRQSCTAEGICWENPLPQGSTLHHVFGLSAREVWAVGDHGTVQRWNGAQWGSEPSGQSVSLFGVWGSAAADVWIVGSGGTLLRYDGDRLRRVPRAGEPGCSGDAGARQLCLPISERIELYAVWGTSASNVWITGAQGTVLHYDGHGFLVLRAPDPAQAHLGAIWGSAWDDVWFVGDSGTVLHYDGQRLSSVPIPTTADLLGIWGFKNKAGRRLWICGRQGALFTLLKDGFFAVPVVELDLHAVFGTPPADPGGTEPELWVAIKAAALRQMPDGTWQVHATSDRGIGLLRGLWGSRRDDVFVVGQTGVVSRWNGAVLLPMMSGPLFVPTSVWGSSRTDIWLSTADRRLLRFDGRNWAFWNNQLIESFFGLSGRSAKDIYGAGEFGILWVFDGERWDFRAQLPLISQRAFLPLLSVWARPNGGAWVVGASGLIARYNGGTDLEDTSFGDVKTAPDLWGVWGLNDSAVWAVGNKETILFFDGTTWKKQAGDRSSLLLAVWAASTRDALAVGEDRAALHWDGVSWQPVEVLDGCKGFSGLNLRSIFNDGRETWVAGASSEPGRCPSLFRYQVNDGKHQLVPAAGSLPISRVFGFPATGTEPRQLILSGEQGELLSWRIKESP